MLNDIKNKIIANNFIDRIRINGNFGDNEYDELIFNLKVLDDYMKNVSIIDKKLALYLYTIPQMIRNVYASFDKWDNKPELAFRLEEAWIELDSLVISCLS